MSVHEDGVVDATGATGSATRQSPPRDATLEQRVRWLEDRAEIDQLISRFSQILDARDIPALGEVATPESVAVMTPGLNWMKSTWHATQHNMTDRWIDVDGDHAVVKANLIGTSIGAQLPGRPPENTDSAGRDHQEVRGRYEYKLVRTPKGWRIAHVDMAVLWTYGGLPSGDK